jgi:hypothetical protein
MLRFFRKIRHNLLDQGKIVRYLTYAIGEIILVVVGILIALQVNNWNEARKDRQDELLILREIHANLKIDLEEFERNLGHLRNQEIACQKMFEIIEQDLPYDESYGYYARFVRLFPRFTPKTSGYQLLKTKGLDLVRSDPLRQAITDLYEYGYNYVRTKENEISEFKTTQLVPSATAYQGIVSLTVEDKPESLTVPQGLIDTGRFLTMIRFEQFKKDVDFHALIKEAQIHGESFRFSHEFSVEEIKALITRLEAEFE